MMMDLPLDTWLLFDNVARHHPTAEVVTRRDGTSERRTYREYAARTQQLMHALDHLGLPRGARVSTLAWNHGSQVKADWATTTAATAASTAGVPRRPWRVSELPCR